MPIKDQKSWDKWVEKNNDPYGGACVKVARRVMELLDEGVEIDTHKLICDADKDVKAGGITGFMAGCVASMVTKCHSRGEEFKIAWNRDNGVPEEKINDGVANPAIMTLERN